LLKSLAIKNFRGIKEDRIDDLGQVNIYIGKNNSGKSTLLDLLCFIKAPLNPRNKLEEFVLTSLLQRRVERKVPAEVEFFYEYLPKNEFRAEAKFIDGIDYHLTASYRNQLINYSLWLPHSDRYVATFSMHANGDPRVQTASGSSGTVPEPLQYLFGAYKTKSPVADWVPKWRYINEKEVQNDLEFVSRIVLIDADFVRKIEKIEDVYWADIIKSRADKPLRKILNQTYGLPIEGFSFANYRKGSSKLFALLPEISMHIDDYGDGFRYAFSILTIASQAKNTALLLEEPEVHQHEGALQPLFEALLELATANKLQLFISTHSPNVLRIWSQITEDARIYHLEIGIDGKLGVRRIVGADAKLMMDLGASPLKLEESFTYLVLEGKEDSIFFEAVAKKLKQKSLEELGYEVLQSPKDEQKTTLRALASTGKPIVSCIDFDKTDTIPDLIKPFIKPLKNKYADIEIADNKINVKKTGSIITFIPMGLPHDKELSEAGISKHTMEDFIVKLLAVDSNIQKWAKISLKELRGRAQSLKDKAPLNSSKTLLMTLGVTKEGKTIEELIPEILDKSDPKLLDETLKPFITQLFS